MITLPIARREQATDFRAAAACLRVLGHPDRLRIIDLLLKRKLTVGALADDLGVPSNVASTHLKLMQRCGFLNETREGRLVYYTVAESHLAEILACIRRRFSGKKAKS